MADPVDSNVWITIGTACAGILSGAGAFFGIQKYKGSSEVGYVSKEEFDRLKSDMSLLYSELNKTKFTVEHTEKTVDRFNSTVDRIHERLDEIVKKLAALEGFNEGRNGK